MRELLARLHESGTTIFLTIHYIEEGERLCQRIAFLVSGRIVRADSVANLLQPVKDHFVLHVICAKSPPEDLLEALESTARRNKQSRLAPLHLKVFWDGFFASVHVGLEGFSLIDFESP